MSPRKKRQRQRDWRSGTRRKLVLALGWVSLAAAVAAMTVYFTSGGVEALAGAVLGAGLSMIIAGARPELERRRPRRVIFSPWRGDSEPSLARQLLTLP